MHVNKVERGLFNYSLDRISPIKPSLYGVYASSFLAVSGSRIFVLIQNHFRYKRLVFERKF